MKEIKPIINQRAVTAAGTPERVVETANKANALVSAVMIRALEANTGDVYVGRTSVTATSTAGYILAPGETVTLDVHDFAKAYIDLSELWIDAATSGNSICYAAVEVI